MANFYCQLDYNHVAYTSPVSPHGTIANNGCGPCSGSMVAENMLGVVFPPEESARFAQECGARDGFGTNLYIYSRAYAKKFGLHLTETEDGMEALRFLQEKRGMVIANVRGDRPEDGHIGVFSDGGHYIVLAAAEGSTVKVWDPMYRPGRFDIPGRAGKVRMDGNDAYADMSVIIEDCRERPYFLFSKNGGETMYTKQSLMDDLKQMGMKPTDTVMVHSSMKSIGLVDGGADTVLDALTEYFAPGVVALPTLSWELMLEPDAEKRVFDVRSTPTSTGLLPEMMRKRPGVIRSLHPTHSVAASGARAEEFTRDDRFSPSTVGRGSSWQKLYDWDATILMLGCKLTSCTFIHGVEQWGPVEPHLSDPITFRIKPEDGEMFDVSIRRNAVMGTSHHFGKLEEGLRKAEILRTSQFGGAKVLVMKARELYEYVAQRMLEDPEIFLHD